MPEFITLLPPDDARAALLAAIRRGALETESLHPMLAIGRVGAADVFAPHPLPEFSRSTVDGYAVRARDTFGASDALPTFLDLIGEVRMGEPTRLELLAGQCALIHTGGMLPRNATAVVMLEHTQRIPDFPRSGDTNVTPGSEQIEVLRPAAEGENTLAEGEGIAAGGLVLPRGRRIGPAAIGALLAFGITSVNVVRRPRVGLISTGDEIIEPSGVTLPGQVRDVNSYTLAALVERAGGEAHRFGIVPDDSAPLLRSAETALEACDVVIITAGSSASTRDVTAQVVNRLGQPGVLVHGVHTRPGRPTILGVCDGKAVIGLPGNPVSALINGYLFVIPLLEHLLGLQSSRQPVVRARLAVNLASEAGREDWWPVRLTMASQKPTRTAGEDESALPLAEPLYGKSNIILTLALADGLIRIPPAVTGLNAGNIVDVHFSER